jgi:excisionase family DNA binding protein
MLSTPKLTRTQLIRGTGSPNFVSAASSARLTKEVRRGKTNTMADSREVMNIRQASQYLGVSPDTLYKYVNEQKIPAFKLGNRWRFKKSKLDQWMEETIDGVGNAGQQKRITCSDESCWTAVVNFAVATSRRYKRRAHVWNGIEDDCGPGCGFVEHQGGRAQEDARGNRSRAPGLGADRSRYRCRFHDRRLGHGLERDRQAVHRHRNQSRAPSRRRSAATP